VSLNGLAAVPVANTWKVRTTDVLGNAIEQQVIATAIDRTIGFITMKLEDYGA
jgi:hypothetical protein